jgi:WD40 repeat protein
MSEGKSEGLQVASNQPDQSCQDAAYFNNNPFKFMTVHNNAIRVWTFDPIKRKFFVVDCALGHIKRFINCVKIDASDTFAYCGTRTGDILEIYLEKASFKRVGPLNRIFSGGISNILITSPSELILGAGDGSVVKVNRKTMKIEDEAKLPGGVACMSMTTLSIFMVSTKGTVFNSRHSEQLSKNEYFSSGHATQIKQIAFPRGYSEVFATCSGGDIRVWSSKTQRELLRIELAKPGTTCNTIEFMADGKLIVSGWSDGKVRAFLPQSGKLAYVVTESHKEGTEVTAITTNADCQRIVGGGSDGEIRLWSIGKQVQKLLMNQKLHTKAITQL